MAMALKAVTLKAVGLMLLAIGRDCGKFIPVHPFAMSDVCC